MKNEKTALQAQNERMAAKLNYFNTAPSELQQELATNKTYWRDGLTDVSKSNHVKTSPSSSASAPTFSPNESAEAPITAPDVRERTLINAAALAPQPA